MFKLSKDGDCIVVLEFGTDGANSIGTKFANNTLIRKFNELRLFTNVKSINKSNTFSGCTNLEALDTSNITTLGGGTSAIDRPFDHINVELLYFPSLTTINARYPFQVSSTGDTTSRPPRVYVLGPSFTSIPNDSAYVFSYIRDKKIVFLGTTPPYGYTAFNTSGVSSAVMYVPDNAVDTYKAAANFANWVSRIKPLSEYDGDRPWEERPA